MNDDRPWPAPCRRPRSGPGQSHMRGQPHASRRSHWVNHLERHAHGRPEGVAFRFRGETTTWRELHDRVERLAAALAARGVAAGDRVAMLMGNRPEYMEALLAANRLGAIGVPVNFRLAAGEIAYILENSGATVLFVDDLGAETGGQAVDQVDHDVELIGVGDAESAAPSRVLRGAGGGARRGSHRRRARGLPRPDHVHLGDDRTPQGRRAHAQNLLSESVVLIRAYQLMESDEVNLVASPMFHIGAIGSIAPLILIGGTMVILPSGAFDAGGGAATAGGGAGHQRVPRAERSGRLMVDHDSVGGPRPLPAANDVLGRGPGDATSCSRGWRRCFPTRSTWRSSARRRCHRSPACWKARTPCARSGRSASRCRPSRCGSWTTR